MLDKTIQFSLGDEREREIRKTLILVYNALKEKGYNPINQIVGYLLSEDPTYITTYHNARTLIRRLDRDEMLQILVKVTVKLNVNLPFKSNERIVSVTSPLVIKMITGQVPEYYYIGSSSASPLSPFTNESGDTDENKPDASPEQGVEEGMENLLLHDVDRK